MAGDVLDPGVELDKLRYDAWYAREDANKKGDQESVDALTQLLKDIHDARVDAVFEAYAVIAKKIKDLASVLSELVARVKNWPFGSHERQFRDVNLPDNDFEDAGPDTPAVAPAPGPIPEDVVPKVAAAWAENYQTLWDTMTVSDDWSSKATYIAKKIISGQAKYAKAVAGTQIPWWFVGVVHSMEGGLDFSTHLYNGDPLTDRTVHHPPGRPAVIQGLPIDWVYSARDSLKYERLDKVTDWSLPSVMYHWHRYNGIDNEYKRRHIPTPYLWSGSQHYVKGKYVSDHNGFDPNAVSKQVGAAVLLKALIDLNAVSLDENKVGKGKNAVVVQNLVANPDAALQHVAALSLDLSGKQFAHLKKELDFPGALTIGANGKSVKQLQEWLNLQGFVTSIDSDFGASTAKQLGRFAVASGRAETAVLDEELWALITAPLRKALAPIPATPSLEAHVVKVARQHVEQKPMEIGGDNCGPWVRAYMAGVDGKEQKWCAGFVSLLIDQAERDLGVEIPFKRQVGVDKLVDDAKKDGRFISESAVSSPLLRQSKIHPGDLFVVRETATDWTHVGFVSEVMAQTFDTLEGNTGGDGGSNGTLAREGNRSYPNKDFIRIL